MDGEVELEKLTLDRWDFGYDNDYDDDDLKRGKKKQFIYVQMWRFVAEPSNYSTGSLLIGGVDKEDNTPWWLISPEMNQLLRLKLLQYCIVLNFDTWLQWLNQKEDLILYMVSSIGARG